MTVNGSLQSGQLSASIVLIQPQEGQINGKPLKEEPQYWHLRTPFAANSSPGAVQARHAGVSTHNLLHDIQFEHGLYLDDGMSTGGILFENFPLLDGKEILFSRSWLDPNSKVGSWEILERRKIGILIAII